MFAGVKMSEIPTSLKVGVVIGLATCAEVLFGSLETRMVLFVSSLVLFLVGFRNQATRRNYRLGGWFETVADENDPGPHPFTTSFAVGMMPIWVVTLGVAVYNWIPGKIFLMAFSVLVIATPLMVVWYCNSFQCRDAWGWLCRWVSDHWYGSKAQ